MKAYSTMRPTSCYRGISLRFRNFYECWSDVNNKRHIQYEEHTSGRTAQYSTRVLELVHNPAILPRHYRNGVQIKRERSVRPRLACSSKCQCFMNYLYKVTQTVYKFCLRLVTCGSKSRLWGRIIANINILNRSGIYTVYRGATAGAAVPRDSVAAPANLPLSSY